MYTSQYECLELFAKPDKDKKGSVLIKNTETNTEEVWNLSHVYGNWLRIPVEKETEYEIHPADCRIAYAYLSGCENILEEGVRFLDISNEYRAMNAEEAASFMDSPYRERYHFSPMLNWNNDPNGLCWFKGYYHMFYQLNPFGQEWNNMYWGHAASRDLMHWIHLPVVLEPQEEILDDRFLKGGAFSGSALPLDDEVLFYLTRHIGPQEDGSDTVQYQTMIISKDMLHFEPEREIIRKKPEGTNHDFRDPKAFKFGEKYYIVLGACVNGKASFLLYQSEDARTWSYSHPLLTEETPMRTIECPDLFALDGKYVLTGAWMCYTDENGRYQPCRYYVGDWQGAEMKPRAQQWVDFGSNCYASQTFEHEGRRILIGWISDFYDEHIPLPNGAYGSMTLPRELHVKENHVYTTPVNKVYALLGDTLYEGSGTSVSVDDIAGNSYYAKVDFKEAGDFSILLGKDGEKSVRLEAKDGTVSFQMKGVKSEKIGFPSSVKRCTSLEIFVDGRTIEAYINQGEDVGTRLFYNSSKTGIFELESTVPAAVRVVQMHSVWK